MVATSEKCEPVMTAYVYGGRFEEKCGSRDSPIPTVVLHLLNGQHSLQSVGSTRRTDSL